MQETPRPQSELYLPIGDGCSVHRRSRYGWKQRQILPAGFVQAMPHRLQIASQPRPSAGASRLARRLISLEHPPIVLQRILRGDEVADDNYRPKRSVA
jgi:hypothetical protein